MQTSRNLKINEMKINHRLYRICYLITIITMILVIIQFFSRGYFSIQNFGFFYIGILFIYSFHKESIRWLGEVRDRRGEYFVYIWIAITIFLYLIDFFSKGYYSHTPDGRVNNSLNDLIKLTLEVGAVFVLTKTMKVITTVLREKIEIKRKNT